MLVNSGNCLLHQPLWQVTSHHLKVLLKTKLLGEIVRTVVRIWEVYLLVVSSRLKRKCLFRGVFTAAQSTAGHFNKITCFTLPSRQHQDSCPSKL